MSRSPVPVVFVCLLVAVSAIAAGPVSHVPKANTRAAVEAYVLDAAKLVQKSGPSCEAFATPAWRSGDYYIFVAGPDNKAICHPSAAIIGKPMSEIVNSKGDQVGTKIVAMSTADTKGWVDYLWNRPGKTSEEPKSTYVVGVKGPDGKHYIVGGGGWNLK